MFQENLENGFILRTVRDEEDLQRYVDFNRKYNNESEGATCECLLRHHPQMTFDDFQFIENENTGEVIATTCFIPWQLSYEGIPLKAVMLEMVLSHPDYRRLGLIRKLINRFSQEVAERQFDLSIITGIPYYYRQYGYAYGLDLGAYSSLQTLRIPPQTSGKGDLYLVRNAEAADISELTRYYNETMKHTKFYVMRDKIYWLYLLRWAKFQVKIIETKKNKCIKGYYIVNGQDEESLNILESAIPDYEIAVYVLNILKDEAANELLIYSHDSDTLSKAAGSLGSILTKRDQWLLKIHDPAAFCTALIPAFQQRLSDAGCDSITEDVIINFYRSAIKLSIKEGKVAEIGDIGFVDSSMGADGGDLCIPPEAFIRLAFGYRTLDQLQDAWPDIVIKQKSRYLLEALFPLMSAHLYTPYHYQG